MAKPAPIRSISNPLLKDVRRAIARGALTSQGLLVAETFHLLEEAARSGLEIPLALAEEGARHPALAYAGRVVIVARPLFRQLSATETPQGVVALVRPPQWKLDDLFSGVPLVVALDGIRDPGNAGAIARAAEAFGATGILFLKGSVSPFNAKTIRASAGSLFRLPFAAGLPAGQVCTDFQQRGLCVYATAPRGDLTPDRAALHGPSALIIGSEAKGISNIWSQSAKLRIPTRGVESLNAALAAAVLLYEASRQRVTQSCRGLGDRPAALPSTSAP